MLTRQLSTVARGAVRTTRAMALAPRALSTGSKDPEAWVPSNSDELHKVTIQSLVHEISLQQMESVQTVVPWFLKSMPAAYFRQVPDAVQRSHLKAVASIYDLNQNDLQLRIEQKDPDGNTDITLIDTKTRAGQLLHQVTCTHIYRVR